MNCKQAKTQLALLIGNDLEPHRALEIQEHLVQCGGCREHFSRLRSCLDALQGSPAGAWSQEQESLWPGLSARLPKTLERPHRLSGWAPSLAVAAACTVMFWFASRQWVDPPGRLQAPGGMTQPVSDPGTFAPRPGFANPNYQPRPAEDESGNIGVRRRERTVLPVVPVTQPSG